MILRAQNVPASEFSNTGHQKWPEQVPLTGNTSWEESDSNLSTASAQLTSPNPSTSGHFCCTWPSYTCGPQRGAELLPLSSLYPKISMRKIQCLCLTRISFHGASAIWVLTRKEFSSYFLAHLHLPSCMGGTGHENPEQMPAFGSSGEKEKRNPWTVLICPGM